MRKSAASLRERQRMPHFLSGDDGGYMASTQWCYKRQKKDSNIDKIQLIIKIIRIIAIN